MFAGVALAEERFLGREEAVSSNLTTSFMSNRPFNQLQGLNPHHAERVLSYLLSRHNIALTIREMICLHALIEVEHVLKYGQVCTGGAFGVWKHGPICKRLYAHLKELGYAQQEGCNQNPDYLDCIGTSKRMIFLAAKNTDRNRDDLSDAELESMEAAFKQLREMTIENGIMFFRGELEFLNKAWTRAYLQNRDMCWYDVLDEYQKQTGEDMSYIKSCIGL